MRGRGVSSLLALCIVALVAPGCSPLAHPRTADEQAMFGSISFRIHPAFTQIKDWTGDNKPDGIEAILEFEDQFGEPTRAAGTVRFELYTFRAAEPDHRGQRLATWAASLGGHDDQVAHWDRAARGYSFQLGYPTIHLDHAYILSAQFDRPGSRLFDQLILEPSSKEGFHGDRRNQRAQPALPAAGFSSASPALLSLAPVPELLSRTRAELSADFDFTRRVRVSRAPAGWM